MIARVDQWLRFTAAFSVSVMCTLTQAAVRPEPSPVPPLPEALGLSTNLVEVTINLALVLAAIVLLAWIFKRAQGFGQPAAGSLRVTATLPLGPKERILLVQVGDEQIVVGASGAGLSTLHVLTKPLPELQTVETEQDSFRDKLLKSLSKAQT